MNFIVTFSFLKREKKESDRVLLKITKIKLQENSNSYFIRIICFYSDLSFHFKINKNEKKEKLTLQNIKDYKLNII